jgi:hypothetical protein
MDQSIIEVELQREEEQFNKRLGWGGAGRINTNEVSRVPED